MPISHKPKGFTLLEVLVSVLIVLILSGLSLVAIVGVKKAASRIQCKNNLRQLGVGIAIYVGDFNRYPLASDPRGKYSRKYGGVTVSGPINWYMEFTSVIVEKPALISCPKRVRTYGWDSMNTYANLGGYGYNAFGTGWRYPKLRLGLGNWHGFNSEPISKQTMASEIKDPSNMIAVGDATVPPKGVISPVPGPIGFWPDDWANITDALPSRIHDGGANILYCDGHLEYSLQEKLIEASDVARSKWNKDNQPHRETW